MNTQTLRFLRRGEVVSLPNVPPDRTLLEVLREDLAARAPRKVAAKATAGPARLYWAKRMATR